MRKEEMKQVFEQIELQRSFKAIGDHNPVITQRFGADPYALEIGRAHV